MEIDILIHVNFNSAWIPQMNFKNTSNQNRLILYDPKLSNPQGSDPDRYSPKTTGWKRSQGENSSDNESCEVEATHYLVFEVTSDPSIVSLKLLQLEKDFALLLSRQMKKQKCELSILDIISFAGLAISGVERDLKQKLRQTLSDYPLAFPLTWILMKKNRFLLLIHERE